MAQSRSPIRTAARCWWTIRASTPRFESAASTLERTYTTRSVLHAQLEPVNALAFEKDGMFEIHAGTQWQSLILPVLAKALGRPQERIVLRTLCARRRFRPAAQWRLHGAGGACRQGARQAGETGADAARRHALRLIPLAVDPDACAWHSAADGKVAAMEHHASAGWPTLVMAPGQMAKGCTDELYDPFAIAGADHWYTVGAQRVRALSNDVANSAFRPGWLRSVGPGWTNWARRELHGRGGARNRGRSRRVPIGAARWRRAATQAPPRIRSAARGGRRPSLKRAAEKAGWGTAVPKDSGLGIATAFGQERGMPTWVACVARVRVDRGSGVVFVEKLTIVVDAGTIVHPDGALAQVEGGALWGLSMALHEGTEFVNGQVKDTNFDTYTPLRIGDVPELDIEFIDSTEAPVGLGEPGTTVVAPAIGNAIFAAVGARLRQLPIRPAAVLAALTQKS